MKNVAIIPARSGSKRIVGKNTKLFCSRPMISWVIDALKAFNIFDEVIVSTDSEEIGALCRNFGASVYGIRPKSISDDVTSVLDVIKYEIANQKLVEKGYELVTLVYATAPMIELSDIKEAIRNIKSFDFAMSIAEYVYPIQRALIINDRVKNIEMLDKKNFLTRSQDLQKTYHDAAHFIVGKIESWKSKTPLINGTTYPVIIPENRVQDIDEEDDWLKAEMKFMKFKEGSSLKVRTENEL